jgi:cupin fold WbuC family metalloprotein
MLRYKIETPEVLYSTDPLTRIDRADVEELKKMCAATPRRRLRICAHPSSDDALHEMLIVMGRENYFPPHRHPGKSESFHVVDGLLTVFIFEENGNVHDRIAMGQVDSGRPFFYRLSSVLFHMPVIESEFVLFHEVTNGPFRQGETEFAPWAPSSNAEAPEIEKFLETLTAEGSA